MRAVTRALAVAVAGALTLTACGEAPDEGGSSSEATSEASGGDASEGGQQASGDLSACEVTDTGGVDDRSFNQTAFQGLEQAEEELGVTARVLESTAETDFEPNINEFLSQGCNLIIGVGFLLADAIAASAESNPDRNFAIIDFSYEEPIDNVLELTFQTDQAAFLAGYLAAGMTETGTVGTYGGINIPSVTIFMDGFLAGVEHHNEQKDTDVQVLGWDGSEGLFSGDFESQSQGRQITDQLLQNGADIIMPVAGPVGLGTVAAVQEAGSGKIIWVDTDGFESVQQAQDLFLTSVVKRIDNAVFEAVRRVAEDEFEGGNYLGTLENEGVGIAPYHAFEDQVPDELKSEIEDLREQIISGELEVTAGGDAADPAASEAAGSES